MRWLNISAQAAAELVNKLLSQPVARSDHCCDGSGTMAMARPEVSTQVRFRKQQEIEEGAGTLRADGGTQADTIVVEMARRLLGENWMVECVQKAKNGGIERILLLETIIRSNYFVLFRLNCQKNVTFFLVICLLPI